MNKKLIFPIILLCCYLLSNAQTNSIRLSELDISPITQPYGIPMKGNAVTGEPLSVKGKTYEEGIGLFSGSLIKIRLHKTALRFTAGLGINDQTIDYRNNTIQKIPLTDGTMIFYQIDGSGLHKQFVGIGKGDGTIQSGSVVYRITGDGKELYRSPIIRGKENPQPVNVNLEGIDLMEILIEDGGDGVSGDHANLLNAVLTYNGEQPIIVSSDLQRDAPPMDAYIEKKLKDKIALLPIGQLSSERQEKDWLIENEHIKATVYRTEGGKDLLLTNGLVSRLFRIFPNLATVDIGNHMTGENMLRAVSKEGILTIDGKTYPLGGLQGQEEFGYTQYHWLDNMQSFPDAFTITDFEISELYPRIQWANSRWALEERQKGPIGKELIFYLEGPGLLQGVKVKLHYALYNGIPCISKWIEVENQSGLPITLDEYILEQLAMAEPESPVESTREEQFLKPNIHIESDWGFLGFTERETERTEFWNVDPRYTSQCNYPLVTPCLLEVKLPIGPDEDIPHGGKYESFRTWLMPFDSHDRDRKGLFLKRMYRVIAPWTTENPIFMHCTSTDPEVVRTAIDQASETGYEMVILSFGSGLDMEDESENNLSRFRELTEYARSKGIELGGYSLLSSRWISDKVDVINPETGERGGMIFGSSPCLSSEWGYEYFRKIRKFFEKTGMTVFENDGSYPGNVCASTQHAHHKGLKDSQWQQRKQIAALYQWMCEKGIYTNVPDYGYILNGSTKVGIGYREVNWSLPRERQLVLGRQVIYDGLWERLPGMCWTFVPLTQYHGGGAAATLEPLSEHLSDYKFHMIQNYGSGVQACYRGFRLYDTEETKQTVIEVINWYKKYRKILNSEVIHLRRPDGKDYDAIMHVDPKGKEKGFVMLYNPTQETIRRNISLPLYYTGLTEKVNIREQEGKSQVFLLDRHYRTKVPVTIPAHSYTWLIIE